MGIFPIVFVNDIYLIYKRDFQNPQQLVQGIKHIANPDFVEPKSKLKVSFQVLVISLLPVNLLVPFWYLRFHNHKSRLEELVQSDKILHELEYLFSQNPKP